jgi:pyruvate/2-oxoglutarate dehydrogenase complex dihydrolipoamide dehydrogenase (E3) component
MEQNFDLIVIGGGPAGVTAALRASELGSQVCLVESSQPGGTAANDGVVPTRTLAYAARLLRQGRQFQSFGLLAELPQIDFGEVLAHAQKTVYELHEKKQILEHLHQAGASVIAGRGDAYFADPHSLMLADGTRLSGKRFIIATGGHSRHLPFPGSEFTQSHADLWRLKSLPRQVTIFGGAATGCQIASILDDFGVQVRLVQRGEIILEREDPQVSAAMQEIFQKRGIQVLTGLESITSVAPAAGGYEVTIEHRTGPQTWYADAVLTAVGWAASVEGLNLEAAGVEVEHGYIKVNDYQQTSTEHIYAAGDITGRMMLVQSAAYEGRLAAENALLGNGVPYKHAIVPHGGFTDPEYAGVGLTSVVENPQDYVETVVPYRDLDRAVIDGHTDGFFKLVVSLETHRVVGACAVGEQAVEIVQLAATAMIGDLWVEQLAEMELAYPTYTAIVGLAARRAMYALGVMPSLANFRDTDAGPAAEWERSSP